jgi:hypothetical protein
MRNKQTTKGSKMKIEKEYKENGIKITRYEAKKTKMKTVIKSRNIKRPAKSSKPKTRISGIYNTTMELTGMTSQDTMASNKNNGREWGKQ